MTSKKSKRTPLWKASPPPPPKRAPGRPAVLKDAVYVRVSMPQALVDKVDAWGAAERCGRSEAFRRLVHTGLTSLSTEVP